MLDVEVRGAEADGMRLNHRLPVLCAEVVAPALEAALAPLDVGGTHLVIGRLDVDLGELPLDRFESELAGAVRRRVEDHLRHHAGPAAGDAEGSDREVGPTRRSADDAVDDALMWFLRTGRLPWSFRLTPGVDLERAVLAGWTAGGGRPRPAVLAALAEVLRRPQARARLIRQFSPEFAVGLLRALSPAVARASGVVMMTLDPAVLAEPVRRGFAHRVWEAALVAAVSGAHPSAEALARTAWRASTPAERADAGLARVIGIRWPGIGRHDSDSSAIDSSDAPADRDPGPGNASGRGFAPEGEGEVAAGPRPGLRVAAGPGVGAGAEPTDDGAEGILVSYAGLVLLHPFLPRFFAGVGVADHDELVDPERALCLLHHLATGELIAPEHHLTVAKVLCGVPLDRPVVADVGITAAEVAEAAALLEAVIGHWAALGHSSPEALRVEFLDRHGVLTADPVGDRQLCVEGRTSDILLDELPWGISMVRLPWMARMLAVQWR